MSDYKLQTIDRRRKVKERDNARFKHIVKETRKAIKEAKNKCMEEHCLEIETIERKHDSFNLDKRVRDTTGLHKPQRPGYSTDAQANPVIDIKETKTI